MKKLLQEVMEDIRLTEKRLSKELAPFGKHSVLTEFEKPEMGYRDGDGKNKFDRGLAAKEMQSKFQSYKDSVDYLATLKELRDKANQATEIDLEWNGKKLTIYRALLFKRSISNRIQDLYKAIDNCKDRAAASNSGYVGNSLAGGRRGQASAEVETFPMLNLKEIEEEEKKFNELLSRIDARVSVANATTEIEVPD